MLRELDITLFCIRPRSYLPLPPKSFLPTVPPPPPGGTESTRPKSSVSKTNLRKRRTARYSLALTAHLACDVITLGCTRYVHVVCSFVAPFQLVTFVHFENFEFLVARKRPWIQRKYHKIQEFAASLLGYKIFDLKHRISSGQLSAYNT